MSSLGDSKINGRADKREKAKLQRGRRRTAQGTVSWESMDWGRIALLVEELARSGGALRLGNTRDGGAFAIGVYLGDDYATEYIKPNEDVSEALDEIATVWLPDQGVRYLRLVEEATPRS